MDCWVCVSEYGYGKWKRRRRDKGVDQRERARIGTRKTGEERRLRLQRKRKDNEVEKR